MLEVLALVNAASAAFTAVKKGIAVGKEIQDMAGQLGSWLEATSAFRAQEKAVEKPPVFRKLLHPQSVEREALEYVLHKQKIMEMEKELRQLLLYSSHNGLELYNEMMRERERIREERARQTRLQARRRRELATQATLYALLVLAVTAGITLAVWFYDFLDRRGSL